MVCDPTGVPTGVDPILHPQRTSVLVLMVLTRLSQQLGMMQASMLDPSMVRSEGPMLAQLLKLWERTPSMKGFVGEFSLWSDRDFAAQELNAEC